MPDPITLADVRAHIERLIRACETEKSHEPEHSGVWNVADVFRRELTEVLAMLDRAQPCNRCGGSQYIRENCHDIWPCPACNPTCPEYKPSKRSKALVAKTREQQLRDAVIDAAEQVCRTNTERQTISGKRVATEDQKRINGAFQDAMAKQYSAILNLKNHKQRQVLR